MEFDERRYRPLSTVDLYDEAFDLYKRNFVLFLSIVAFVVVPSTIFTDVFATKWLNGLLSQISSTTDTDSYTAAYFATDMFKQSAVAAIVYIPAWTLVCAATTAAVSARYLNKPITLLQSYLEGARRYASAFGATILFLLIAFSGYVVLAPSALDSDLVPLLTGICILIELPVGIFVMSRFPLYFGAVVAERLGPIAGLKRSAALTKSDSGRVVWAIICLSVISVVISLAVYFAIDSIFELCTGGLFNSSSENVPAITGNRYFAAQIAGGLTNLLLTPFGIIVISLLYYDQRIRKEGFDIEILAQRLGYRPVATVGPDVYSPALTSEVKVKGKRK